MIFMMTLSLMWLTIILLQSPMMSALSLFLTAISVCWVSWVSSSKWAALTIALVYIGGMLIVILYVCSLKNDAKILPMKLNLILTILLMSMMFYVVPCVPAPTAESSKSSAMSDLFYEMNSMALMFLAILLIFILFIIMESLETFKGALIKKF